MYSNCCCSCSFEPEIIKIGQSSYKMYSNNILNFQESTTILNAHTKKVWKLIVCTSYYMMVTSKMQDMLHALEKVNVDSNPSDNRIKRNITTVEDLERYFQTPKLQAQHLAGKM